MSNASGQPVATEPANVLPIIPSQRQDEDAFLVLTDERTGEVTLLKRVPQATLPRACEEVRYESVRVIGVVKTGRPTRPWLPFLWPFARMAWEVLSAVFM